MSRGEGPPGGDGTAAFRGKMARRTLFLSALALPGLAAGGARAAGGPLRIGYQKNGTLLIVKQQRRLETRLGALGVAVEWHEFAASPPMLEAMNAGGVDFGTTGDMPPVFAQAAGADLVYVASIPVPGASSAILVRKDGPIRALADLKGRGVAVTKGSSAHNVLLRVLRRAGLDWSDIRPAYLSPPDAMAAFRQGAVDAWSIWDPFYAIAERDPGTRVLTDAVGVAPSNSFYLARRSVAQSAPATVIAMVEEIRATSQWIGEHQDALARAMAEVTGVPEDVQRVAAARGNYDVHYMTDEVVHQQQEIADAFRAQGLIPRAIRVRDAVWTPPA